MGQYYRPTIIAKNNRVLYSFYSHDYDSGLKLMEHSWMKNDFVRRIEDFIDKTPRRLVWAGDYADDEKTGDNLYIKGKKHNKILPEPKNTYRYVANLDKKEYVDKIEVPKDKDGWQIHPLPLLTCEGNGRGGGDYRNEDPDNLIGSWARNQIIVTNNIEHIPEDFTKINFNLIER